MTEPLVAPSILASDFANIQSEVEMINTSSADYIHIDIMDGIFVPNISFGFPVCAAISKHAKKPLDYHLMIQNADNYLMHCIENGAEVISVHVEACTHLHRTVTEIKSLGAKAGVALNPHTPVGSVEEILHYADVILVMAVNPGFGGQKFIESTYSKVERIRKLADTISPEVKIEIDGGVDEKNAARLVAAGADILVAGSFVFTSADPIQTIANLRKIDS